ncbi:MAG: alpha-E domain-containing protein [Proteobacteria bacterium]|nr:alpha-E domain-containing protein [Pseudomonadota bacterium]
MLSSVASRLYWLSRYLERTENTARILNTYANLLLDLPKEAEMSWLQMIRTSGYAVEFEQYRQWPLERSAIKFMTSERENPGSIQSTIDCARENMRTLREYLPKEAFEAVNELHIACDKKLARAVGRRARYSVLSEVVERCQQINGLFAGTMNHGEGYQFIRLGRSLERADMTTRIIDVASDLPHSDVSARAPEYEITLWVNVLRSLSAYQSYRQSVRSRITPVRVLHFVLNNIEFPRSVAHCLNEIRTSAQLLPKNEAVLEVLKTTERQLGSLSVRALAREHLQRDMDKMQNELGQIHNAVGKTWFAELQ